ncbi:glycosyltransferase family 2 protein [uncultured Bacteroides sp.]|uniref:glycosyltransferase family 2 protein n=1 Tax=uncultured Bacteroides sp. TaxID=162156 RepID=UPI0025EA56E2|nr:glycosyltransferase family 2 protein [uncultured Bacteroides sp.]
MEYSVVIRTLGKGGEFYQKTLDSLVCQTIVPKDIIVYIAEGYPLPKETIGIEKYVYVKKGMVAQRALPYNEVKTEYILFLDDDVYLPPTGVEILFRELHENNGDVISPCVFYNHEKPIKDKIRSLLLGREVCRISISKWGFKVLPTAGFSYINNPIRSVYESQTNAGPCFFCKKQDFLNICYEEELWLDGSPYAFPDDQVMFYKMYMNGLKILTSYDSGILHLDAGTSTGENRMLKVIYSEYRNKLIFWHRFIYMPEKNIIKKVFAVLSIFYVYGIQYVKHLIREVYGDKKAAQAFRKGVIDGKSYIKSFNYKCLRKIEKKKHL